MISIGDMLLFGDFGENVIIKILTICSDHPNRFFMFALLLFLTSAFLISDMARESEAEARSAASGGGLRWPFRGHLGKGVWQRL